jgi:hypothetical protein
MMLLHEEEVRHDGQISRSHFERDIPLRLNIDATTVEGIFEWLINFEYLIRHPTVKGHYYCGPRVKKEMPYISRIAGTFVPQPPTGQPAAEHILNDFAGEWHYYHNTRDDYGEFWSYAVLKFPPCRDTDQKLVANASCLPDTPWKTAPTGREWTVEEIRDYKNKYLYQFEASLVDGHLVIQTTKDKGRSDLAVRVFRDPLPQLATPKTALMLITHTWAHTPAVVAAIMKKGSKLSCDDAAANTILEQIEDGEPIRNPIAIKALSDAWAKWCPPGITCLIPGIGGASNHEDITCHYIGDDLEGSRYTTSQHKHLRRIRDTHVISNDGAEHFDDPDTYSILTTGLTEFLSQPGTHFSLVAGHRIDRRYIEHMLEAATNAATILGQSIDDIEKNKITCYRLRSNTTRVTNFLILDYKNSKGTSEAVFGWRQHTDGTPGRVFRSDDSVLVRELDASFKNLCQGEMSVQVPLRSLLQEYVPASSSADQHITPLEQEWDEDKCVALWKDSKTVIRMFVSFFIHNVDIFGELTQVLNDGAFQRRVEIMMLDPGPPDSPPSPVLECRYGRDKRLRRDKITATDAKDHILAQLKRLQEIQQELDENKKEGLTVGTLRVYLYDISPTIISYQSDNKAVLGTLLIHASGNYGPMIHVNSEQPLWTVIRDNWNAILQSRAKLVIGTPEDYQKFADKRKRQELLWS